MAAVEDQKPVEAFGANGADERSVIALAFGARTGVCTMRIPSLRKTTSKGPLYLLSPARIRKWVPCAEKSRPRLRAC